MIATDPGGKITTTERDPDGNPYECERPAFLVDGATVPGSSGSPVFLKPAASRIIGTSVSLGPSTPPYLLGIVTEGAKAPIDIATIDKGTHKADWWAGLGVVLRAEAVRETIELFFEDEKTAS